MFSELAPGVKLRPLARVWGQELVWLFSELGPGVKLRPLAPILVQALAPVCLRSLSVPWERVARRALGQTWRQERTDFSERIWEQRSLHVIERVQLWRNAPTRMICPFADWAHRTQVHR